MDNSPDPAELARIHTRLRRRFNWLWFGAAVLFAGGGAITSAFTRNIYDLYGGLFFAVFPLIGLLLNHFV